MAKKRRKVRRKNPYYNNLSKAGAKVKRGASRAKSYGKSLVLGVNMPDALRSTIPLLLGALAAKFTAKKFSDGGAEADNWTWKNYAFGLLGTLIAAFATQAIFKARTGTATKVMEGGLILVAYKLFTNEIAPQNTTLQTWFGENEAMPEFEGYANYGAEMGPQDFRPGDIWQGDLSDYVMGEDGYWRPIDEGHRSVEGLGQDTIRPSGGTMGRLGDVLRPAGATMGEGDFEYQW